MNKLTKKKYDAVPNFVKGNIVDAAVWAERELTMHGGGGHEINVLGNSKDSQVCCCFSKAEWPADYCGQYMDTGSEAIVIAVYEYLSKE